MPLFPAHAGVILHDAALLFARETIPRTRGGDPLTVCGRFTIARYSPHTRG